MLQLLQNGWRRRLLAERLKVVRIQNISRPLSLGVVPVFVGRPAGRGEEFFLRSGDLRQQSLAQWCRLLHALRQLGRLHALHLSHDFLVAEELRLSRGRVALVLLPFERLLEPEE